MTAGAARLRLPIRGRVLNVLGEARALFREESYLDKASILDFAHRNTGLTDFGSSFEPRLVDVLLESARVDANLTFLGRRAFGDTLGTTLAIRLLYVEARKRHPEIFAEPVRPPMLVMGSPRSGTTLMQRLLALHDDYSAVPNWELRRPVPKWALDRDGPDRRLEIAERVSAEGRAYVNSVDHAHFSRPTTPGECIVLMMLTLRSPAFWMAAPVHSYAEELLRGDGRAQYREYVELLKLLQRARPGRALLLKAPAHTAYLDRIVEMLPGAAIIQMHRDPTESVVSLMSLVAHTHANVVKRLDLPRTAEVTLAMLTHGLERNLEARALHGDVAFDVSYRSLIADPVAVLRRIYERFGVLWPGGHEKRVREYLGKNPKGKHGRHEYRAEEFGLTDAMIRRRMSAFYEAFDLAAMA